MSNIFRTAVNGGAEAAVHGFREADHFGRIGAQTAKQIILQRMREVERDQRFDQLAAREGDLITGSVSRVEPRAIILDVGKGDEAILQTSEQSPLEHYRIGQPVKATGFVSFNFAL